MEKLNEIASSKNQPVVEGIDIYKSYPFKRGSLPVLKGVNIAVKEGEAVAVVGVSGAGKSTLLHLLAALDRPDKGKITLKGHDLGSLSDQQLAEIRNQRIGLIFQFHHLLPEFTAVENCLMPSLIGRRKRTEVRDRAKKLLSQVGLSHRLEHKPGELSCGEQQRVAIARALINNPELILADEPTGNLDEGNSREIYELLLGLTRDGGHSLLIVTHDRELVKEVNRVVELSQGKTVEL
ncbi:MAG: ABC transporter ATP-binding protein [bacterium]